MRIGFDAKRAFLNQSGLGNYSRLIINMVAKTEETFLYTPKFSDDYSFNTTSRIQIPTGLWKYAKAAWRSKGIIKSLKQDNIELYHGLSNELPVGIGASSIKSIVTIHDLIFLRYPELYKKHDRLIYERKTKRAIEQADKVIAISSQTKKDLKAFYGLTDNQIEVIYQDCDLQFRELKSLDAKEIVLNKYGLPKSFLLSVGTIEPRKNQLLTVKTAIKLKKPVVLIGRKTAYYDEIQEYVKSQKSEHLLYVPDNVAFQDFPSIYQSASVFMYPSKFEGFGIPILEALRSRVPVITTNGSCFEETGGDAAVYISDTLEEALEASKSILENEDKRKLMIALGEKHAAKFDVEKSTPQLLNLYRDIID